MAERQNSGLGGTTTMAVAIIAASLTTSITVHPILPRVFAEYRDLPNVAFLVPLIISLPALISIFTAPLVGWLSDKIGRRSFVIWASLLAAILGTAPIYLESLHAILITRALMGLVTGSLAVCTAALVGDLFHGDRRKDIFGAKFAVSGAAHVGVNILMGYLAYTDWRNAFFVFGWGIVAALLMVMLVPREEKDPDAAKEEGANVAILWLRCLPIFIGVFLGIMAFDVVITGVPFILSGGVEFADTRVAGMALGMASLGMLAGALTFPFAGRWLSGAGVWSLAFALAAIGFAIISFGSATMVVPIFLGTFIACTGTGLIQPNSLSMLMAFAPSAGRGRVVGIQMTFVLLGFVVGPFIGVTLAQSIGSGPVYLTGALMLAGLTILCLLSRRPAEAADAATPASGLTIGKEGAL